MKTKITLAIIALLTITYSCTERTDDQEVILVKKETINKKKEFKKISSMTNKSISDSVKNGNLLNGTTNQNMEENKDDSETVNPGQLGTPPTRP